MSADSHRGPSECEHHAADREQTERLAAIGQFQTRGDQKDRVCEPEDQQRETSIEARPMKRSGSFEGMIFSRRLRIRHDNFPKSAKAETAPQRPAPKWLCYARGSRVKNRMWLADERKQTRRGAEESRQISHQALASASIGEVVCAGGEQRQSREDQHREQDCRKHADRRRDNFRGRVAGIGPQIAMEDVTARECERLLIARGFNMQREREGRKEQQSDQSLQLEPQGCGRRKMLRRATHTIEVMGGSGRRQPACAAIRCSSSSRLVTK